MTRSLIGAAAALCLTLALGACASGVAALPTVGTKDNSPRAAAVMMAKDFGAPLAELADACEAGLLGDTTREIVADHGQTIRKAIGAYADTARACLVTDGRLETDPASGGECYRGNLKRATGALPAVLKEAGQAIGGAAGREIYLAGLVASTFIGTGDGGILTGFKQTSDVPLATYDAAWAPVQASADRLAACAAAPAEAPEG